MDNSLTQGNIRNQLISLAAPLLLGNILQQLYNTIDAVIVGVFVGQTAFAAVGVAGSIMNLFIFLINGGCAGAGILLSQYYGADDLSMFRKSFFLVTAAGIVLTLLLSGTALITLCPMLELLKTPSDVIPYVVNYLEWIYIGLLSCFAFHLSSSVLRCAGDTRSSLYFLLLSMVFNLILDVWFVAGLSMGTMGAALATVIAQIFSALICVGYMFHRYPRLIFHFADFGLDIYLLRKVSRFSLVSALQMCNLYIGKLLVQRTVNTLGTDAIAAYTAAVRIEGFANSFGDSGSTAMSVFVGQNTGANECRRIKQGYRTAQVMLFILGVFMSAMMIIFAEVALDIVLPDNSGAGIVHAVGYLRLVACFYLFNFLGSGLSGYFHGRGKVNLPVIGTTIHITMRVILAHFLAPVLGLKAVAVATGIGWMTVVLFWTRFRRNDFRRISVVS